jgi:uncharacterized coiled-coil DUF342 family protein
MDINILKTQAKELTGSLRELGSKKEQKYREKTKLGGVLNKLIKEAVDLNARKKEIEKELSSLKKQRNNKNKEVREGLKKLKHLKVQHKKNRNKSPKINKEKLLAEIQQLDYQVQTGAVSMTKEKNIMKKIKSLKKTIKDYQDSQKPSVEFEQVKERTKLVKKEADSFHDKIQTLAKESSQIFDRLTVLSKEITTIKRQRNVSKLVLNGLKDQINIMNAKLGGVLREMSKLPESASKSAMEIFNKNEAKMKVDVKEALKTGKKLSKDDILKLQKGLMKK